MATKVVNLKTDKYDVYIGRTGRGQEGYFGNPFRLTQDLDRHMSIKAYEFWFYRRLARDPEFKRRIDGLKGKTLGCFCKPLVCHGDVIVAYLEGNGRIIL